jgi:hydrogenase maturation protease
MNKTLVVGYGNTLRGDDGAGFRAAELIANTHPDIDCVAVTELTPELAETVSCYDTVLFVDASMNANDVLWRPVSPPPESDCFGSHALTPETLLGLAIDLYDRCPGNTALVEIPAREFRYNEKLSDLTHAMLLKFVSLFAERRNMIGRAHDSFSTEALLDQSPSPTPQFLPSGLLPS